MEFTILDYHILNLLAENSMATEHIIKSRLHQNINNRKHLLVRLEMLSQQGLIKTSGGVTYSLSSLGMVIMGKKPAEPQHLVLHGQYLNKYRSKTEWLAHAYAAEYW